MTNFLSGKKKILTMILGIVSGLAMIFGLEQTEVNVISGAIVAAGSVISYLMVEGKIDVERLRNAAIAVNDVFDYIGEAEPEKENIEDMPDVPEEYAGDVAEAIKDIEEEETLPYMDYTDTV